MRASSSGLSRYYLEYAFHQLIEQAQTQVEGPIMVSEGRRLRAILDEELEAQGTTVDGRPNFEQMRAALEATFEEIEGIDLALDEERGAAHLKRLYGGFTQQVGLSGNPPVGGPRLPISPYDPRWSTRRAMLQAGTQLRYVLDEDVEQRAGGAVSRLSELRVSSDEDFPLYTVDETSGRPLPAGQVWSLDDASGLSVLASRMSDDEYTAVRDWVIAGARVEGGAIDPERFMTPEAVQRSAAMLDELHEQGMRYTIARDARAGQIKARIAGTSIEVRLTDQRENENFAAGRVTDNGIETYYSTNLTVTGLDGSARLQRHTPIDARQSVDLVRIAQGRAVARWDDPSRTVGELASGPDGELRPGEVDSYYATNNKTGSRKMGPFLINGAQPRPGASVFARRVAMNRSARTTWFDPASEQGLERAEQYLKDAVESARANLAWEIDVEGLIAQMEDEREAALAGEYLPELSGDQEIAAIQRAYWSVLLRDGELSLQDPRGDEDSVWETTLEGDVESQVRRHAELLLDEMVGTYDPIAEIDPETGDLRFRRFNPAQVSVRMDSEHGQWRNQSDLVVAMKRVGIDGSELRGETYTTTSIRDRLIEFDETTARSREQIEDPFLGRMLDTARAALERNGARVNSLELDEQGIIRYEAVRFTSRGAPMPAMTGQIGQIFERGEHGEVITRFAASDNYLFAPGYEARILGQRSGEDLSVEERTRVRGYEEIMAEKIEYQIAGDMVDQRTQVGDPTSLNRTYRELYDTRHPVDFMERSAEEGMSYELRSAILATESRRVRYDKEFSQGSTIYAAWRNGQLSLDEARNDNYRNPWAITGGRNMSVMTAESDGYFDPVMTTNEAMQGLTRFMVEGAEVDADGRIIPGDAEDRTPLMKLPQLEEASFDPYDRQQMTGSNLLHAQALTENTKIALITFGGFNMDDAAVVSKEFAEKHMVRSPRTGELRPLMPGDKISDLHGNKGVISLIVDRDRVEEMRAAADAAEEGTIEHANARSMLKAHEIYALNPELEIAMAPVAGMGRFNAGTGREMMKGQVRDLLLPDGTSLPVVGEMSMIITHKDVESGSRVYSDEEIQAGGGRKASPQLANALQSQEASALSREIFGRNESAFRNLREYLVVMGGDISPEGTLRVGFDAEAEGAERRLIEQPPLARTVIGSLNKRAMVVEFGQIIGTRGGDIEMPFPIKLASGEQTPETEDGTFRLPLLSSHLRSGVDLGDGVSTPHDYTSRYTRIFEQACTYRDAAEQLENPALSATMRETLEATMADARRMAQAGYDSISTDIAKRRFEGKHNIIRDAIMSTKLPHSATGVIKPDSTLALDEIGISPEAAKQLKVVDGADIVTWRDPIMRDAPVRGMRVKVVEGAEGFTIHPAIAKTFDGDFDGDSMAIYRPQSAEALKDVREKLSVHANLLDKGSIGPDGRYAFALQDGLDVAVAAHQDPDVKLRLDDLNVEANQTLAKFKAGELTRAEMCEENRRTLDELSLAYAEALCEQYATAYVRIDSAGEHLRSIKEGCIDTGAKGNIKKFGNYATHFGAEAKGGDWEKTLAPDADVEETVIDHGRTLHTREQDQDVMFAVAVKTFDTGNAGAFNQRGVKGLRNEEIEAVMEITHLVTQGILQVKHDATEARRLDDLLKTTARDLWRGHQVERVMDDATGSTSWKTIRDKKGRPLAADRETWKAQFEEFYKAPDGLNVDVNPEHIHRVAGALVDSDTEMIRSIEAKSKAGVPVFGATMDHLAYGGTFADVREAMREGKDLYEGRNNETFAPESVQVARKLRDLQAQIESGEKAAVLEMVEPAHEASADERELGEADAAPVLTRPVPAFADVRPDDAFGAKERGASKRSARVKVVRTPQPEQDQQDDYDYEMGM